MHKIIPKIIETESGISSLNKITAESKSTPHIALPIAILKMVSIEVYRVRLS
jgi:hypothetical protein